jgi:membrane-associated phospholipid phosphatase
MGKDASNRARDYNGPSGAGRAPAAGGLVYTAVKALWPWGSDAGRRFVVLPVLAVLALFVAALPLDGPIARGVRSIHLGGDVRRELEAIQQYGQGVSLVIIATAVWLLDAGRRRRLLDLAAAAGVAALAVNAMKMLIGRPRPKFDDPQYFLGPWGAYPINEQVGVRHAWEFWRGISSDLWSMPSSHTVYAVVVTVFLSLLYPRLRPLVVALAFIVGLARVLLGAHYVSDVVVGAGLGFVIGWPAVRNEWGQRLLARVRPGRTRKAVVDVAKLVPAQPERCPSG